MQDPHGCGADGEVSVDTAKPATRVLIPMATSLTLNMTEPVTKMTTIIPSSRNQLVHLEIDTSASELDTDEYFSYSSDQRLVHWEFDSYSGDLDSDEYYSYSSSGFLVHYERDALAGAGDLDEYFSYDSHNRLVRWELDSSTQDLEATFRYEYVRVGRS